MADRVACTPCSSTLTHARRVACLPVRLPDVPCSLVTAFTRVVVGLQQGSGSWGRTAWARAYRRAFVPWGWGPGCASVCAVLRAVAAALYIVLEYVVWCHIASVASVMTYV